MTIGQRIAAKRKEHNLSQEALGEALGVSRQAIYKWESDATLPEIEKLIALSRLFDVSVGWLLGVEEKNPASGQDAAEQQTADDGFSEKQLKMIEELLKRYAQDSSDSSAAPTPTPEPAAAKPKRRRWPYVLIALVFLFLIFRVEQLKGQYDALENNLQNSINNVSWNVNNLTSQIESILKAQNSLAADYSAEFKSINPAANTATFTVSAVPKTYVDGMQAVFLADSSGQIFEQAGAFNASNQQFSGEITCELTDDISLSVAFIKGNTKETQLLDQFEGLYTASFPQIDVFDSFVLWNATVTKNQTVVLGSPEISVYVTEEIKGYTGGVSIDKIEVGLFCNRSLLFWAAPHEHTDVAPLNKNEYCFRLPAQSFPVTEGALYQVGVRVTDNFGRTYMISSNSCAYIPSEDPEALVFAAEPDNWHWFSDPSEWIFD